MRVTGLDHIVLNVADVERSLSWYVNDLGLHGERVEEWRRGEVPFPSVRVNETTIVDIVAAERTGENMNHVCFVVSDGDIDEIVASDRFDVLEGPVERWGAYGVATSVYLWDPDANLVELRHYG